MLVDNVKAMQVPQNLSYTTAIWFERADSVYGILPHSLYLSRESGFTFRGRPENGKVDVFKRSRPPRADNHQVVRDMVQGTSEIVDSVPHGQGNTGGNLLSRRDIIAALSFIRIIIEPERVATGLTEGGPLGLHVEDVLFGPFDFLGRSEEHTSELQSLRHLVCR